jgi:penicillin-binding protein 2
MSKELIQKKKFTRRAIILGACKAGLIAGLFSRMFYLQVLHYKKFAKLSDNNHIKTILIPPLRGKIVDRNNIALAVNEPSYQLAFTKLEQHSKEEIYEIALKIGSILGYSPEEQANLNNELINLSFDDYLIIEESLKWNQLMEFELNLYDLPGINIETGFNRYYPYADLLGHITGYMGKVSDKDKSISSLNANLKVGKNGIEKTQENILHGNIGQKRIEVNAKGQIIKEISTSKSISGQNINLAIDIDLQKKAAKLLGDSTGVVLLSKINTGEIITSLSLPSFDPNLFNNGISTNEWNKLINNPELPLIDRSVALTYPPGSGFKINVAIAALKQNFDPETKFFCPGYYTVGERKFKCWHRSGHGSINLYQAIAGSCNVYFWNVAKLIGIQPIADVARMMGYDQKLLNNSLPREQNGIIPDPAWKTKNIRASWTFSDTINSAIGQGYVEATPMQILTMISRIASGKAVIPSIFKSESNQLDFKSLNIDKELKIVKKGMEMVVNNEAGTAYANRIINADFSMAGKTGTSQVISKRHAEDDLSKSNVDKRIKNHGIFVAYAPLIDPKYAFCGIIEHGGTPALAVKIAKELLTEAQLKKA